MRNITIDSLLRQNQFRNALRLLIVCLIFLPCAMLSGCLMNSKGDVVFDQPHCRITSQSSLIVPSFGFPKITFTVMNDGDGGAANSVCIYVRLKNGNQVLEDNTISFGYLNKGESRTEDMLFSKITSASDYTSAEVKLYWYDADGGYYE